MRELFWGGSRLCELTFILSGATTLSSVTKSMGNPQVSGKNKLIVWPMYSIVCFIYWLYDTALLEDCINKQYKCVLLLLYPKPITFIFCIMFHRISCWQNAPFFIQNIYFIFEEKKICDVKSPLQQCQQWLAIVRKSCRVEVTKDMSMLFEEPLLHFSITLPDIITQVMYCMHWYGTKIMHYILVMV